MVCRFVKSIGKTDVAEDSPKAINMIQTKQYDLILMDINLGAGDNGIKLLHEIKKIDSYKNIPAIALTGYASTKTKTEMLEYGFAGYIAKPVEKEELLKLISTIIK